MEWVKAVEDFEKCISLDANYTKVNKFKLYFYYFFIKYINNKK